MTTILWRAFFEDDVDKFRTVLANASYGTAAATTKGKASEKSIASSYGTSPSTHQPHGRGIEVRNPSGSRVKPTQGSTFTQAGINLRDNAGLTLLHHIASSTNSSASQFVFALLEVPFLDLYIQDAESGWTALHRALYFGNVTIARAISDRDLQDAVEHNYHVGNRAGGLIKIKDKEGNGPFDLFAASIAPRSIVRSSRTAEISATSDEDDDGLAEGVSGDRDDEESQIGEVQPIINVGGDEFFAFGSNQNLTLGFGDEDDRQFPERIYLKRPDRLVQRLVVDHYGQREDSRLSQSSMAAWLEPGSIPACVKFKSVVVQDVQMSKLHTAVVTTDPESNLFVCGFGPGGRLGTGDEITRFQYVSVSGGALVGKRVVHIGLGQNHTVAITSFGETVTWGNNSYGQLGYSTSSNQSDEDAKQLVPKQVFGILKKEKVLGAAASKLHTVVHTCHSVYTFGKNEGQLGLVDSDARSLKIQNVPRKIAASLFSSAIKSVTAIDHATICLLESHEVWIFANYGYKKLSLDTETLASHFLRTSYSLTRYGNVTNHIIKVTAKRDTICALTSLGEVFTVSIKARLDTTSKDGSTTNPAKIRNALSVPVRVWSNKKEHMRVQDVDVGQDGSIIICTAAGSVWTRIKRTKIKTPYTQSSFDTRPRDYKFSRIPGLTNIVAVRANAHGAHSAIRQDCDVLKEQVIVGSPTLWRDLFPLLSFRGIDTRADEDSACPTPRFWVSASPSNETAGYRRAVLTLQNLEAALASLFQDMASPRMSWYDVHLAISGSKIKIPANEFMLASRSTILRQALVTFREEYYYSIPEVLRIEYDEDGRILITFLSSDIITIYNLILYVYTDTVADVWHHTRNSPRLAPRYRQIRIELMRVASALSMRSLESAVRLMTEPHKTLQADMEAAVIDKMLFISADVEIELKNRSIKAHSAILCQRCPFFEGLLMGRTGGGWLSSRKDSSAEPHDLIRVDLSHVDPNVFRYVLRYLYADSDTSLFDDIVVADLDEFIDFVLEVLSVADELLLERLSEVCQKVLARHANTRNICQLLNAVAPCSVTSFKEIGLEYICLNLDAMLESNLLSELDEDLMVELDAVVRENQLSLQPVSRSGRAEAELLEQHPDLKKVSKWSTEDKLDSIEARTMNLENEPRTTYFSKGKGAVQEHSLKVPRARRRSSQQAEKFPNSPKIRVDPSLDEIFPSIDDDTQPAISTYLAEETDNDTLVTEPHSFTSSVAAAQNCNPSSPTPQPGERQQPWGARSFTPSKLGMTDIMAQANNSRTSTLSAALVDGPSLATATKSIPAVKISQKERKRQQQEASKQKSQSEVPTTPAPPPSKQNPQGSPWQMASRGSKPSLKDIIGSEASTPPVVHLPTASPRLGGPSHTLRQTVPGNMHQSPKSTGTAPPSPEMQKTSQIASPINMSSHPTRPTSSRPAQAQPLPHQSSPASTTTPVKIQSVRHAPLPSTYVDTEDPYSVASYSISDIVSQQQMEKDAIKEAAAKRSLQEIQNEQAFQEWWDEESRKVQQDEEEQQQEQRRNKPKVGSSSVQGSKYRRDAREGGDPSKRGHRRGGRHGREKPQGSTNTKHASDKPGVEAQPPVPIIPSDKASIPAGPSSRGSEAVARGGGSRRERR